MWEAGTVRRILLSLGGGGVLACNGLAGIEQIPCVPACVDAQTRLVCERGHSPRAERCPESSEVCAESRCDAGECGFRPAVGKACGPDARGTCNAGYACLGPSVQLSAISKHTCLVAEDGKVWCWGTNQFGELGDGTAEHHGVPVMVQNLPGRALQVSLGYQHTCALLEDYQVYCWGDDSTGQCGTGAGGTPVGAPLLVAIPGYKFTKIAAGARHTCALTTEQEVVCWGNTTGGQCGVDPVTSGWTNVYPTRIPHFDEGSGAPRYLDLVVDIETVKAHTCARRSAAPTLVCWGSNTYFERHATSHALGPAAKDLAYSPRPVPIELAMDVVDVGTGFESTYAVTADGRVFAWGWNERGQLGSTSTDRFVPEPVPVMLDTGDGMQPLTEALEVLRTDGSHQCARVRPMAAEDGVIPREVSCVCWGANDHGEVGLGEESSVQKIFRSAVSATTVVEGARDLVSGENHACFLLAVGGETQVHCYGAGVSVGNGSTDPDAPDQLTAKAIEWDAAKFAPPLAE